MKTTKIIIAGLAGLLLAACAKEAPIAEFKKSESSPKTFSAGIYASEKTTLKDAGKIVWAKGDEITVYDAAGGSAKYIATDADNNKETLNFTLTLGDGPYYAVETRSGTKIKYNGTNGFTVHHINAATGAFSSADALVASSTTTSLSFKHATGWLRFQTSKYNSIVHLAFDKLAMGGYNAVFAKPGEDPIITAEKTAGVSCDTSFVRQRTDFIIPVIPGTYKFSIVLETNEGVYMVDATKDMTVARGEMVNLGNIDTRLTKLTFYESFDQCKDVCGNDGAFNAGGSTAPLITDVDGWIFQSAGKATTSVTRKACISVGASSKKGTAITPALGITGDATITFKLAPYGNTKDFGKKLNLSLEGVGTLVDSSVVTLRTFADINSIEWKEYKITVTGMEPTTKLKLESSDSKNNRFFLDEVKAYGTSGETGREFALLTTAPTDTTAWAGQYMLVWERALEGGGVEYRAVSGFSPKGSAICMRTDVVSVVDGIIKETAESRRYVITIENAKNTKDKSCHTLKIASEYISEDGTNYYFKKVTEPNNYGKWNLSLLEGNVASIICNGYTNRGITVSVDDFATNSEIRSLKYGSFPAALKFYKLVQ